MKKPLYSLLLTANCLLLTVFLGCSGIPLIGKKSTGGKITIINENLNPDRLVDVKIIKELAGQKKFLIVSNDRYTDWLLGFLKGEIVDEKGVPLENIQIIVDGIGFENAVTDINGIYKVRFKIPIVKGIADANGKLIIHPKWETELEVKGMSYQPTIKDAPFRIYYNGNAGGIVALNEGKLPPTITLNKITQSQYKQQVKHKKTLENKKPVEKKEPSKKAAPAPEKTPEIGIEDDLFKALEDFNK
ncbi:MAG: hypothetical protein JW983_10140 [Elusimicrobia bacterium]|nr:hypothetical protein [Elusimicrobiota bacterium]